VSSPDGLPPAAILVPAAQATQPPDETNAFSGHVAVHAVSSPEVRSPATL